MTVPPVGLSSAARRFKSVVLPEPDSPMMATYSPSSTLKFTFLSASTWFPPKRVLYTFLRFSTVKILIAFTSIGFTPLLYSANCSETIDWAYIFAVTPYIPVTFAAETANVTDSR